MCKNVEALDRMLTISPAAKEVVYKWYLIHNKTEVLII